MLKFFIFTVDKILKSPPICPSEASFMKLVSTSCFRCFGPQNNIWLLVLSCLTLPRILFSNTTCPWGQNLSVESSAQGSHPCEVFHLPFLSYTCPQLDWLQSKSWIYLVAFFFMHLSPFTKMQICREQVLLQTCFCISSAWRWLANPLTWVKFIRAFKTPWAPSPGWSLLLRGGRNQNSFAKLFISWLKSP